MKKMKISFVKYEKESNYKIPKLLGMKVEEIQEPEEIDEEEIIEVTEEDMEEVSDVEPTEEDIKNLEENMEGDED